MHFAPSSAALSNNCLYASAAPSTPCSNSALPSNMDGLTPAWVAAFLAAAICAALLSLFTGITPSCANTATSVYPALAMCSHASANDRALRGRVVLPMTSSIIYSFLVLSGLFTRGC
ncbi:MAG: hypothetical protein F4032_06365 [Gemmatimonadetes bacterium]|nr:hypothetical protein [Gemmatimonadota bacterium]MYK51377.1 hypothetical protein [Gemmatimonadota bacterium]